MMGQLSTREAGLRRSGSGSPLEMILREMDQLFSDFFGDRLLRAAQPPQPRLDLSETDGEIQVHMDLPGYKREEIDISLNRDTLTITGEYAEQQEDKDEERHYHRIERRRGEFRRTIQLPAAVQEKKVEAHFKDGVLTITMPKAEESKSHTIPVKG